MINFIYKEGKSEIFDLLCDNDICDKYNILKYDLNDNNHYIYIDFKDIESLNQFKEDFNI